MLGCTRESRCTNCDRPPACSWQNDGLFSAPSGNDAFDIPFLLLQIAGVLFYIIAIAKPRRFSRQIVKWTALLLIVALPLFWASVFPQQSGIEGAARLILAVPLIAINMMLAFAAYLRARA